jgi:hypothetical protein
MNSSRFVSEIRWIGINIDETRSALRAARLRRMRSWIAIAAHHMPLRSKLQQQIVAKHRLH